MNDQESFCNPYPRFDRIMKLSGLISKFTPVTIDMSASPALRLWQPMWSELKLEEQPVSIVMLGPRKSKKWDTLFEIIVAPLPVSIVLGRDSGSRMRLSL
jgi:hypothetical protein